jgi:hypothetical protein
MNIINQEQSLLDTRSPRLSDFRALFDGRLFWINMLTSFIASTGLPPYQAGLLNIGFLVALALLSSRLINRPRLSFASYVLIIINPLLLLYSTMVLNDISSAFYTIFSAFFFIKSLSVVENEVHLDLIQLSKSFSGLAILAICKLNLLISVPMWLIMVYMAIKYRYFQFKGLRKNILKFTIALPLLYLILLDIPYVILEWIFRNETLASIIRKVLIISPTELFLRLFIAPWWEPNAPTLFSYSFDYYLQRLYRFLSPETSNLLISSIILILPFFIFMNRNKNDLEKKILSLITVVSFITFYFTSFANVIIDDLCRYSLWMIPLWYAITLLIINQINEEKLVTKVRTPLFLSMIGIILINSYISKINNGVYVSYGFPTEIWTIGYLLTQFIFLLVILNSSVLEVISSKLGYIFKNNHFLNADLKNIFSLSLLGMFIINSIYFSSYTIGNSLIFENYGFNKMALTLEQYADKENLVFANNHIYLNPYIDNKLLQKGLLLPPPDTRNEFQEMLQYVPNGTMFFISQLNKYVFLYEYANEYSNYFIQNDVILPVNNSQFGYVSVPVFDLDNNLTISIWVYLRNDQPQNDWACILGNINGQPNNRLLVLSSAILFQIQIDGKIYTHIKTGLDLSDKWHQIVISYNGSQLRMYLDKIDIYSNTQTGVPDSGISNLTIGWGSNDPEFYQLNGLVDEVKIYNRTLSSEEIEFYYKTPQESSSEDLMLHYTFDEGSGTVVHDISGNKRDGLLYGGHWVRYLNNSNLDISFDWKYAFGTITLGPNIVYALSINNQHKLEYDSNLFTLVRMNNTFQQTEVVVKSSKIAIKENDTIVLNLELESPTSKNVTILIATDKFTKFHQIQLNAGLNNVNIVYDSERYKWYLTQPRIIVIENWQIIYNKLISIQNTRTVNVFGLIFLIGSLIFICLIYMLEARNHQIFHSLIIKDPPSPYDVQKV